METYHGDPATKTVLVERCQAHEAAGRQLRGEYWTGVGGCAIGMMGTPTDALDMTEHLMGDELRSVIESRFGLPARLLFAIEGLYEHMDPLASRNFTSKVAEAIPVGVDLTSQMVTAWACTSSDVADRAAAELLEWLRSLKPTRRYRLRHALSRPMRDIHRAPARF